MFAVSFARRRLLSCLPRPAPPGPAPARPALARGHAPWLPVVSWPDLYERLAAPRHLTRAGAGRADEPAGPWAERYVPSEAQQ